MDKWTAFIGCHLQSANAAEAAGLPVVERPTITISRQAGAGARVVAEKLAAFLQKHAPPADCPWTVIDRNLVEQVLEDHNLPKHLAQYMPEDKIPELHDAVGELLGLHPSQWTLVQETTDTILRLAKLGNVILVGRGANVIASKLTNAFHVRLIGSFEKCLAHVQEYYGLDEKEAKAYIQKQDRSRKRYLKRYFDKDVADPMLYHLVINTDYICYDEAVAIIGRAVIARRRTQ